MSTTPDRRTVLELDGYHYASHRPSFFLRRRGHEIGQTHWPSQAGRISDGLPGNVVMMPGGAWMLHPHSGGTVHYLTDYYADGIFLPTDLTLAPGMTPVPLHRVPTLTGMAPAGSMVAAAGGFRKTVPHTGVVAGDWSKTDFPADRSAFAQPPGPPDRLIPTDRVLVGLHTQMENAAFGLDFSVHSGFWGTDALKTFYFGGPALTTGGVGGQFCLELWGDGTAHLSEMDPSGTGAAEGSPAAWRERKAFRWAEPHRLTDTFHSVAIIPIGLNRMVFISGTSDFGAPTAIGRLLQVATGPIQDLTKTLYIESADVNGHAHYFSETGQGVVRLDIRRDIRTVMVIRRIRYPLEGWLYDAPFELPFPLPEGEPIRLLLDDAYTLLGGTITPTLIAADSDTPCTFLGFDGARYNFGAVAGEACYYAGFHFQAGPDAITGTAGYVTPVLYSYAVGTDGFREKVTFAPTIGADAVIQDVTVTGPDQTPDTETASIVLKDFALEYPQLLIRDRIPAALKVIRPSDDSTFFYLFEGETVRPEAELAGKTGRAWPPATYRRYDPLRFVGAWARLYDQIILGSDNFDRDPNAPPDPTTNQPVPWKVTDIIVLLLQNAGVPDDEIDVPDSPMRLWFSPNITQDAYTPQPTVKYGDLIKALSIDVLGQYFIRDRNAGARGMWRLLPATPSGPILQNIYLETPPGVSPTAEFSYGSNATFARRYTGFTVPPEFNVLIVTAEANTSLDPNSGTKLTARWHNAKAINWPGMPATADPTSPDFTNGQMTLAYIFNSFLTTPEAVAAYAKRVSDFAGHGEWWVRWTAPLVPVIDPTDFYQSYPRPLRINDRVYFPDTDQTVIIRNANPLYRQDFYQWCDYEGIVERPDLTSARARRFFGERASTGAEAAAVERRRRLGLLNLSSTGVGRPGALQRA